MACLAAMIAFSAEPATVHTDFFLIVIRISVVGIIPTFWIFSTIDSFVSDHATIRASSFELGPCDQRVPNNFVIVVVHINFSSIHELFPFPVEVIAQSLYIQWICCI